MPKPIKIKRAYGWYRKGDIITPSGMDRSFLLAYGYADEVQDTPSTAPVIDTTEAVEQQPEMEDEPDFAPEPDAIQQAVAAVARNTARFNKRRGR